jgi:hypothetical protein
MRLILLLAIFLVLLVLLAVRLARRSRPGAGRGFGARPSDVRHGGGGNGRGVSGDSGDG